MRKAIRFLTAAMCLSVLADFAFAASTKLVPAKEGIVMAEGEAQMYSDGYKVRSVTILYRKKIDPTSVSVDDYYSEGRKITSVSVDGKNVRIFFDCDNAWYPEDKRNEVNTEVQFSKYVTVTQKGEIRVAGGNTVYTGPASIQTKKIAEPKIVKEFSDKSFKDENTGLEIHYSIYMPLFYTEGWDYPLIVFIPDSRANADKSKTSLLQGEGGVVWASEAEQEKHKAIVIAIQYPKFTEKEFGPLVKEDGSWTPGLDAVYAAIMKEVTNTRTDRNRVYAVGQGDGAVANLMIGNKYPGLYAAQFAISPMYELKSVEGLENQKLWVMVSSNDRESRNAMDKAVDTWEKDGLGVSRANWDVDYNEENFSKAAKEMTKKKTPVKYTVIDGGNREYTWCIGHRIEEIRDWLTAQ